MPMPNAFGCAWKRCGLWRLHDSVSVWDAVVRAPVRCATSHTYSRAYECASVAEHRYVTAFMAPAPAARSNPWSRLPAAAPTPFREADVRLRRIGNGSEAASRSRTADGRRLSAMADKQAASTSRLARRSRPDTLLLSTGSPAAHTMGAAVDRSATKSHDWS